MASSAYNYRRFDHYVESGQDDLEFSNFADHLQVGKPAPDATLTRLDDNASVRLSGLWTSSKRLRQSGEPASKAETERIRHER